MRLMRRRRNTYGEKPVHIATSARDKDIWQPIWEHLDKAEGTKPSLGCKRGKGDGAQEIDEKPGIRQVGMLSKGTLLRGRATWPPPLRNPRGNKLAPTRCQRCHVSSRRCAKFVDIDALPCQASALENLVVEKCADCTALADAAWERSKLARWQGRKLYIAPT